MKEILEQLVAIPTVSGDHQANKQAIDYIDRFLSARGLFIKRFNWNGFDSLVATTRRTKSPKIMLAAHVDVVPAPQRLFTLEERDGKFYGRGTCDMKFAIANYMQLVDDLREDLDKYDFGIMITSDEEISGHNGTKKLLDEAGYRPAACVLPDGGDNWALEESAKGFFWITATATGTAAHASRPWEGESAIEKMLSFLQALRQDLFTHQGNDTNTCNIGTITGGDAPNQVADTCSARLDIRFLSNHERTRLHGRLIELAAQHDISLDFVLDEPAVNVDLHNPYVTAFVQGVEKVLGHRIQTVRSNGGSDARFFAAHNIPTLVVYPTGGGRHSDHEWVDVAGFYQYLDILRDFVGQNARITDQTAPKSLTSVQ